MTGALVKLVAMLVEGAAGPSWADAADWRRFCSCFKRSSDELCSSLAAVARKPCTQFVDPVGLGALVAGRLVPLDKIPGVRPLSIYYFSPIIYLLLFLLHVCITWAFPIIIKFHRS